MWLGALLALLLPVTLFTSVTETDERVLVSVPYRSQVDGSPYASANCGPVSVAMVLEHFGIHATSWDVRVRAMQAQGSWTDSEGGYSHSYGVFIQHLATVVQGYGLRTYGLWQREGTHVSDVRQWDAAAMRQALRDGHPVIVQVNYRTLPGREDIAYFGDHYMVVHGFEDGSFVYSDPMDRAGGGPSRLIAEGDLMRAMQRASNPRAAFAIYPRPSPND